MSSEKKQILIVISSNLFVRNYILTDAFKDIEEEFKCFYIASTKATITDEIESKNNFLGFYEIDKKSRKLNQRLFDTLMWKNQDKSTSFYFRMLRTTPSFQSVVKGPKKTMLLRLFRWVIKKPFILIKRILLTNNRVFQIYTSCLIGRITTSRKLKSVIDSHKFHYLIYPSAAYEPEWSDLVKLCRKNDTQSLFLVDNWDNLSSKTIAVEKPDFIGVWGEQAKSHAIDIHEFNKDQIILMGTPRFDSYFILRDSKIPSHFSFPYILFVGTALNFDEETILHFINDVIERNKKTWGGLKVIYRPHPWRQNKIKIESSYGINIITDPQALAGAGDKTTGYQPDLNYYPSLLQNAEYITGGLTTMMIEGLIFYKQFLAVAIDDGTYMTNMRNVWKYFEHFKGIDSVDAVTINQNFEELEINMLKCWEKRTGLNKGQLNDERRWYLFDDHLSYSKRLLSALKSMR